ncbi:hypothetical protein NL676_034360 [Syzygium grande]|nr:hypothetical protein NL676_034360 [Syzygium grande]
MDAIVAATTIAKDSLEAAISGLQYGPSMASVGKGEERTGVAVGLDRELNHLALGEAAEALDGGLKNRRRDCRRSKRLLKMNKGDSLDARTVSTTDRGDAKSSLGDEFEGFPSSKPDQFGSASDDGRQQYSPPQKTDKWLSYQYLRRTGFVIPTTVSLAGTEVSVDEIGSAAAASDRYPPSIHAAPSEPEPDPSSTCVAIFEFWVVGRAYLRSLLVDVYLSSLNTSLKRTWVR